MSNSNNKEKELLNTLSDKITNPQMAYDIDEEEQIKYPTLYFNAAKDIIDNADSIEALFKAYEYLDLAGDGYTAALHSGNKEYEIKFNEVNDLMDSDIFSEVRDIVERDDIYSGDDDECDGECEGHCHCHH